VRPVTLGQVLAGTHPGRAGRDELTVYAPAGLPWQDLAAAWIAHQAAIGGGRGVDVNLLARKPCIAPADAAPGSSVW
jgi:ornithine cyclodeaminase